MAQKEQSQAENVKSSYLGLLDQASDLAKQSIESTKKFTTTALNVQKEAFDSISTNTSYAPFRNIASIGMGYVDMYARRVSEGLDAAKKTGDVFTEVALSWQKVALEAQKNLLDVYANYFARFRA